MSVHGIYNSFLLNSSRSFLLLRPLTLGLHCLAARCMSVSVFWGYWRLAETFAYLGGQSGLLQLLRSGSFGRSCLTRWVTEGVRSIRAAHSARLIFVVFYRPVDHASVSFCVTPLLCGGLWSRCNRCGWVRLLDLIHRSGYWITDYLVRFRRCRCMLSNIRVQNL